MKSKKRVVRVIMALVMALSLLAGNGWPGMLAEVKGAEGEEQTLPVSGTSNGVEWSIDENGHLEISGSGDWERVWNGNSYITPWYSYRESIVSAKVTLTGATDLSYMFRGCANLTDLDLSGLDTGNVTNMGSMFANCTNLTDLDVRVFDTENVTNMGDMFANCTSLTDIDVSEFATGNVTDMGWMFAYCTSLTDIDVSEFATGNVTSMYGMFYNCTSLTNLNVSGIDTRNVTNMGSMFAYCTNLTNLDVRGFGTGNVWDMGDMFGWCSNLTDLDVSGFETGNVRNMEYMFYGCENLTELDVSRFDTENVTDMGYMFGGCTNLTNLDVSGFDTGSVTDMGDMFYGCENLTALDVSRFDTENVTDMGGMFGNCTNLTNLDVSGFDAGNVTDMEDMFSGCFSLISIHTPIHVKIDCALPWGRIWKDGDGSDYTLLPKNLDSGIYLYRISFPGTQPDEELTLPVSGRSNDVKWSIDENGHLEISGSGDWNRYSVGYSRVALWYAYGDAIISARVTLTGATDLSDMFVDCKNLTDLDLSGLDTRNVMDMGSMFAGCKNLTELDVSGFDTKNVTYMSGMFSGCANLKELNVSGFKTGNVTDMGYMFSRCTNLTELDVSGFDTGNVEDWSGSEGDVGGMEGMFDDCDSLISIHTPVHVKKDCALPDNGMWKDGEGNVYTMLPQNLDSSIYLYKTDFPETQPDEDKNDTDLVAAAKAVVEEALSKITVDNDTTREDIQKEVDCALTAAKITAVTVTVGELLKTKATVSEAGRITGSIAIEAENKGDSVAIEKEIAKLPETQPGEDTNSSGTQPEEITTIGGQKVNETAPNTTITDVSDEVKNNVLNQLTEEERKQLDAGEALYLYIQAEHLTEDVPEGDKTAMESVKGDNTIGMFIDLSLFLKVGDRIGRRVTNPVGNVEVSIDLPLALRNSNSNMKREFVILHVHDGKAEVISTEYNPRTHKLTFETSGFSTFAIAYTDTPVEAVKSPITGEASSTLPGMLMLLVAGLCVMCYRKARG